MMDGLTGQACYPIEKIGTVTPVERDQDNKGKYRPTSMEMYGKGNT
jgi:hypothetical protein